MTIYIAEIKGRGIAAFHAESDALAEHSVRDRVFRDDLMALATDDLPLWDGMSTIQVRRARPGEEANWQASRAKAVRRGDIGSEDHTWVAFLVPLSDPDRRRRRSIRRQPSRRKHER